MVLTQEITEKECLTERWYPHLKVKIQLYTTVWPSQQ